MNTNNKAIISLSGGLDSTCLLLKLLSRGYEVKAYGFDYGQKHTVELKKVKENIKFLQSLGYPVTHQVIDLRDAFSDSASSLHQGGEDIPEGHYNDLSMKSTVVENRNIIFSAIIYGKALAWAKKTGEHVDIFLGIHAGDGHSVYKDCTPESRMAAELTFKISNWDSDKVNYVAPFENVYKADVLTEGLDAMENMEFSTDNINFVLSNTHSCYNPDERGRSCGKCGTCVERLEAFAKNSIKDPIEYQQL